MTVSVREQQNYFLQQGKKLFFLGESFGGSARICHFEEGNFSATQPLAANILGGVGNDRAHPGASLWPIEVGMVDSLQDFDPADLEGVFSEAIVPGNPLGEGKETLGTASNPSLLVPFQKGAFPCGSLEAGPGQNVQTLRHFVAILSRAKSIIVSLMGADFLLVSFSFRTGFLVGKTALFVAPERGGQFAVALTTTNRPLDQIHFLFQMANPRTRASVAYPKPSVAMNRPL